MWLLRGLGPADGALLAAALVGQQNCAHGAQGLIGSYVERHFLLDGVANVGVEATIVASLGLYFSNLAAHARQSSPVLFRFQSPIGALVGPVGAIGTAQNLLLRIHAVFDERSFGSMKQHVGAGSVGDNAGAHSHA